MHEVGKREIARFEAWKETVAAAAAAVPRRLKSRRSRRESSEAERLMTPAGPGPRWRNGREVEVCGRRRAQTAVSIAPDLPHATL